MGKALRALIVEDSEDDEILIAQELGRGGFELTCERVDTVDGMGSSTVNVVPRPGSTFWPHVIRRRRKHEQAHLYSSGG